MLSEGGYCRTVDFKDKKYVILCAATASRPYLLDTLKDHSLVLRYPKDIKEAFIGNEITVDKTKEPKMLCSHPVWNFYTGTWTLNNGIYTRKSENCWQSAEIFSGTRQMEIEADIILKKGVACGITIRPNKDDISALSDVEIMLDAKDKKYLFPDLTVLHINNLNTRDFNVKYGKPYHLKILKYGDKLDIFIDDILYLHLTQLFPDWAKYSIGVIVDRGETQIEFTNLRFEEK